MVIYPNAVRSLAKETTNAHYKLLKSIYYVIYFKHYFCLNNKAVVGFKELHSILWVLN